jgi:hypothetical protein
MNSHGSKAIELVQRANRRTRNKAPRRALKPNDSWEGKTFQWREEIPCLTEIEPGQKDIPHRKTEALHCWDEEFPRENESRPRGGSLSEKDRRLLQKQRELEAKSNAKDAGLCQKEDSVSQTEGNCLSDWMGVESERTVSAR